VKIMTENKNTRRVKRAGSNLALLVSQKGSRSAGWRRAIPVITCTHPPPVLNN